MTLCLSVCSLSHNCPRFDTLTLSFRGVFLSYDLGISIHSTPLDARTNYIIDPIIPHHTCTSVGHFQGC